jgi:hypothetical protein
LLKTMYYSQIVASYKKFPCGFPLVAIIKLRIGLKSVFIYLA